MKKICLFGLLVAFSIVFMTSSMLTEALSKSIANKMYGPIGQKIFKDYPSDLSGADYCNYKFEKYEFPDGKVADVYVFEEIRDQAVWLNVQKFALMPSERERYKRNIANGEDVYESNWHLNVTGPMTPFYTVYSILLDKYGQNKLLKMAGVQSELFVNSFYKPEDLGVLGNYLTEKSSASACYEDENGVYWLRISSSKNAVSLRGNKKAQKDHKGEFVYDIVYIPKRMYPKIDFPKLPPAKVTPFDPNNIPDSDRDLQPSAPKSNSPYYYDGNLAYTLQWLAVKIACKGTYDMAYTGDFSAENPVDWYKTSFIKKYLAKNGEYSKGTDLFEGICFDYADFAYRELTDNRNSYQNVANYWMVGSSAPNDIQTYRIAKKGETGNGIINGTPIVEFTHAHIRAHADAINHAWFWVQANDGVMYWVDPTWTDNSGRPVYGIVRGGQEIQLEPDPAFCVN